MVEEKLNKKICVMRPNARGCSRRNCSSRKLVISKLERVQNYNFLERYSLKMKLIRNKYEKLPHVKIENFTKSMFHGMKGMDAKDVLDSAQGLDKRYTFTHAFGIGVYFAVCSDYSHPGYWYVAGKDQNGNSMHQTYFLYLLFLDLIYDKTKSMLMFHNKSFDILYHRYLCTSLWGKINESIFYL